MPIFVYKCSVCGRENEKLILKMSRFTVPPCCNKQMEQMTTAPSIRFKGPGFYVNDYREDKDARI